jgi:hypothetical protein
VRLGKPIWFPNQMMPFRNTILYAFPLSLFGFFYVSQSFSSLTDFLHLIVISTSRSHYYLFPWYIHVYYTPTIITMHVFVCELIYWLTCELHNVFQQIFLNLFCSSRKSVLLLWTYLSSILVDGCWLLVPVWKTIEGLRIGNPSSL